jgi:hypothetical protein
MNSTVNRYKLEKLVKKFTSIDKRLTFLRSGHSYHRGGRNIQVLMSTLVLAVVLLSCDASLAFEKFNPVFCIIERMCQVITLVAIMQYCKMALMIHGRLSVMYEILFSTICKRLSHTKCGNLGSGAVNAPRRLFSQTYNTLHTPVFDLLDDLESFNEIQTDLKTASFCEIELLLELRRIYYNLCECSKCINLMYGLPILIHIFRTATGLIVILYCIGEFFDEHTGLYVRTTIIVWTVVLLGPIISLTVICDMAASKTKDIEHKLLALLLTDNVSSEMVGKLKLFCQQMSNYRIAFTAAGLFDVNLSFLCTFLTSVTTYVVVLIQFKLH